MEGIPQDILDQHRNRIIQNFYQAQEDRRIATGNPLPGQAKQPRKKLKVETPEELKARLAEHRAKRAAGQVGGTSGSPANGAPASASPGAFVCETILLTADCVLTSTAEQLSLPPTSNTVRRSSRPDLSAWSCTWRSPISPTGIPVR